MARAKIHIYYAEGREMYCGQGSAKEYVTIYQLGYRRLLNNPDRACGECLREFADDVAGMANRIVQPVDYPAIFGYEFEGVQGILKVCADCGLTERETDFGVDFNYENGLCEVCELKELKIA